MPLYDFQCEDCGKTSEILMTGSRDAAACSHCGSTNLKKLLSASSSLSGEARQGLPGPGDTACCGAAPGAGNCAGPGSCCGRGPV
jgi:putative FmdB family regulatory protein